MVCIPGLDKFAIGFERELGEQSFVRVYNHLSWLLVAKLGNVSRVELSVS